MTADTPSSPLLSAWRKCERLPGGNRLFSLAVRRKGPYTGTIRARIEALAPGYSKVRMTDRRGLRNHLRSIHAIALANLGELASGLAMMASLPDRARGIPIEVKIEYLKKARGVIVAEGRCEPPDVDADHEHPAQAVLTDELGETVARFTARWMVGPAR